MKRILSAASITALTLTAACGSDGASNAASNSSAGKNADRATASSSSTYASPLGDALGQTNPNDMNRQMADAEKKIQTCMAKEGFKYIPSANPVVSFGGVDDASGPQNKDWRAKHGYGIVEQILDPGAGMFRFDPKNMPVDPNQKIVENLSKAEQRAYHIALDGFDPEDPATANGQSTVTQLGVAQTGGMQAKGCRGQSMSKLFGGATDAKTMELTNDIYQTMNDRIAADPRIKKLNQQWASCVAKAGFSAVTRQEQTYSYIQEKAKVIAPNAGMGPIISSGGGASTSGSVDSGGTAPGSDSAAKELTEAQKKQLKALKKNEVALATADFDCQEKYDIQKKTDSIRIEIEKQIVDERGSDLANIKAGGGGGGQG
ncbi:MAG: hypothetical protein WBD02_04095 [Acidimicrobiia bacterium]